ncbi:MAG: universal stress protein [Pseudomonadales bacterium]|jgi:universal stress protein A
MSQYRHILLAVDLSDESLTVAERAAALAQQSSAKLSMVHVIEPINFAYGGDIPMDLTTIQDQLDEYAHEKMAEFAKPYNIGPENQHIAVGLPQNEIHRIAKELQVDLIVVGTHGRHGLSLLLGSTSNGVLHGAECDMLAVRVGEH